VANGTARLSSISVKEITAPAFTIDNLKGNIVSASFGPAEGFTDQRGPELLTDPELDDPGAWTQGDGWSVAGGKAVCDGTQVAFSDLRQDAVLIPLNSYIETVIDCEAVTGEAFVRYGASAIDSFTTPGIHKIVGQVLAGEILRVRVDVGTTCTLRSVSSKVMEPNTLVLNNLDELHDDYPANGVGKIRRGSVVYNADAGSSLVLSGGVARPAVATLNDDLTEITPIPKQAGAAALSRVRRDVISMVDYPLVLTHVADPSDSPTGFIYRVAHNPNGDIAFRVSDGTSTLYTVNLPFTPLVADYQLTRGGYTAGEPDPAGSEGVILHVDGQMRMSASEDHASDLRASKLYSARGAETELDSLQTKIDRRALLTPQRALFNDTFKFGPELMAPIEAWTTGGPGFTFDGTKWNCDGSQVASAILGTNGVLELGKTYEWTFTIENISAGGVQASDGGFHYGDLFTTNGTHTTIATQSGGLNAAVRGDATFVGSITAISVKETSRDIDNYIPENGVPFTDFGTGGGIIVENGYAKSADGVHYGMFSNPGGSFWEMSCEVGHADSAAAYCALRWIPGWGVWYGDGFLAGLFHNAGTINVRLLEYVGDAFQIRINQASTLTAAGDHRFIVTDDGETITIILPGTGEVFSYASTVYADEVGCGFQSSGVGADVGLIKWYAARTGSVNGDNSAGVNVVVTQQWTTLSDYLIAEGWNVITLTSTLIQIQLGAGPVYDITLQMVLDCDDNGILPPLWSDVEDWRANLGYPCS
jgi:hypothetical protein